MYATEFEFILPFCFGSPCWCRYSMFYVLYPSGIVSEVALIILALPEMKVRSPAKENLTNLNS